MSGTIVRTIKCVLYPTKEQEVLFKKFCGISRFAYNYCLDYRVKEYEKGYYTNIQDCIETIRELKCMKEYNWIQECPESVTKQAIKDLDNAFKKFYKGETKFPVFKSKHKSKLSFYQRTDKLKITKDGVTLTRVGLVKYKSTRKHLPYFNKDSNFKNPRVSFDGKHWMLTFGVEIIPRKEKLTSEVIGIDVGVKTLATLSNHTKYKGIRYDTLYNKYDKQLKRLQRKLSHKYECNHKNGKDKYYTSNHIQHLKEKIRKVYKKLQDIRNTYLDTISSQIVKTKPSAIVMEDLNIQGMLKVKHQARRIQEQAFYLFKTKVKHKCEMYGIAFLEVGRFYPSSKLCSGCGNINKRLKLKDREYICECGVTLCRDINAAINLSHFGKLQLLNN